MDHYPLAAIARPGEAMSEQPTTEAVDLKPCPFCGGTDTACGIADEEFGRFWVECICGARGPTVETLKDARPAWNKRLAPEPAARLEYQPGSLTEEEIAGGADIPNCLRCGRTLFGGHSHDSRWYCSSETKAEK